MANDELELDNVAFLAVTSLQEINNLDDEQCRSKSSLRDEGFEFQNTQPSQVTRDLIFYERNIYSIIAAITTRTFFLAAVVGYILAQMHLSSPFSFG